MNLVAITLGTIVCTRILVASSGSRRFDAFVDSTIGKWWHHFYTGLLIILISLLFFREPSLRTLGLGIGTGLIIDEAGLPLYIARVRGVDYWSAKGITIVVVVFLIFAVLAR